MAKEEFRSSPEVRRGFVKGNTFGYRPVRYSVIDGEAIFEGDIVLGSVDEMERLVAEVNKEKDTKAVIITGAQFRWPDGVVPFTIDPELPNQGRVNDDNSPLAWSDGYQIGCPHQRAELCYLQAWR